MVTHAVGSDSEEALPQGPEHLVGDALRIVISVVTMKLQTVIIRKEKEQGACPEDRRAAKVVRGHVREEGRTGRDGLGSEAAGCSLSAWSWAIPLVIR